MTSGLAAPATPTTSLEILGVHRERRCRVRREPDQVAALFVLQLLRIRSGVEQLHRSRGVDGMPECAGAVASSVDRKSRREQPVDRVYVSKLCGLDQRVGAEAIGTSTGMPPSMSQSSMA